MQTSLRRNPPGTLQGPEPQGTQTGLLNLRLFCLRIPPGCVCSLENRKYHTRLSTHCWPEYPYQCAVSRCSQCSPHSSRRSPDQTACLTQSPNHPHAHRDIDRRNLHTVKRQCSIPLLGFLGRRPSPGIEDFRVRVQVRTG